MLNKQIFWHSIATDFFYTEEERRIHHRMLWLYSLRSKTPSSWEDKTRSINRVLKKEKDKLTKLLNAHLQTNECRTLTKELSTRNVISCFDSSTTRHVGLKDKDVTDKIMTVNVFYFQIFYEIVMNGFYYNGEKYVFLGASAGSIRKKRGWFIEEKTFERIQPKLNCGLTIERINAMGGCNTNKFLSYNSLNSTATDVWENFNIRKSIVVDDFMTEVKGYVDHIDDKTYQIERKEMNIPIEHMDGCGVMLNQATRMVRLPWVKGLMVQFPFDKFIQEKCDGVAKVKDIYGKEHDIVAEGIEYIFTKSQFKMWKYYHSWDEYCDLFEENGCEACYCNMEEMYVPKAKINYQMLQTLTDCTDKELEKITKQTVEDICKVGEDYSTTMRVLGATSYNRDPNHMQRALMIYPELLRDNYNKEILKNVKQSLVKNAKAGKLRVNGHYRFVSPDLYAFSEWLFLGEQNPKGLLEDGEIYFDTFDNGDELDCLRSPHLYREHAVRKNVIDDEKKRWFTTKSVYISSKDLISRILQCDFDGDTLLVVKDRAIVDVAKRNMVGIVPLYYEMKKAEAQQLSNQTIYDGMVSAFTGGNIGIYSNNISKIWNSDTVGKDEIDAIKLLCCENNYTIDYAKTLYKPQRPPDIDKKLKEYTRNNLPHFFISAKNKTERQVVATNNSTMGRIEKMIPDPRLKYCKTVEKCDYRNLLSNKEFEMTEDSYAVVYSYDYWNKRQNTIFNHSDEHHCNEEDLYVYIALRDKILTECKSFDVNFVVDSIVTYLYTVRKASNKKMLWSCFGNEIVSNLKSNVTGRVCPECGNRFESASRSVYCDPKCKVNSEQKKRKITAIEKTS